MTDRRERGTLFVISAPSGTGKSTLARRMIEGLSALEFSVSYTTRRCRPGEVNGREYHFVDDAVFDRMVAAGDFLEWAHVFGKRYGTARRVTQERLSAGRDVLLDIDVQGARQMREHALGAVSIFLLPPDYVTLESRLTFRGSEPRAAVARRLAQAREEAGEYTHYDYVVINDELDRAARELCAIVVAERARRQRRLAAVESILNTFPAMTGKAKRRA